MQAFLQGLPLQAACYGSVSYPTNRALAQVPQVSAEIAEKAIQHFLSQPELVRPVRAEATASTLPSRPALGCCRAVPLPKAELFQPLPSLFVALHLPLYKDCYQEHLLVSIQYKDDIVVPRIRNDLLEFAVTRNVSNGLHQLEL